MPRERLTVRKLYDKIDELAILLQNASVEEDSGFGWIEAVAGLVVGLLIGLSAAKVL